MTSILKNETEQNKKDTHVIKVNIFSWKFTLVIYKFTWRSMFFCIPTESSFLLRVELKSEKSMVLLGHVKQEKDYSEEKMSKWLILEMIKACSRIECMSQRSDVKYKDAEQRLIRKTCLGQMRSEKTKTK